MTKSERDSLPLPTVYHACDSCQEAGNEQNCYEADELMWRPKLGDWAAGWYCEGCDDQRPEEPGGGVLLSDVLAERAAP